jgi:CRP-like cAMP-binding protein
MVRFGYQDNLIVALDSFLTDQPSLFYIQAIKSAQVNVITKAKLKQFISVGQNNILWIGILENLIMQQMNREIDILTSSPKERYKRVLARSPQLFQQIPHKYIANYLRMSAETLSRLKKS